MATHQSDQMLVRLEKEVEQRTSFVEGLIAGAQDAERDLTDSEHEQMGEARKRIEVCERQITSIAEARSSGMSATRRMNDIDREMSRLPRNTGNGDVEYRSAGAYVVDMCQAHNGNRDAKDRLEVYNRTAAHELTTDVTGLLPTPIVGDIINRVDAARPITNFIGVQALTSSPFRRPKVTQNTVVDYQGTDGSASQEKVELDSQKMTITADTVNAVTYGGYVNVSRQSIDFTQPNIMDIVINNLAEQYAIRTEEAVADAIAAVATADQSYPLNPDTAELAAAVWAAAGTVYAAVKGQGRLFLAIAPDKLGDFGPLFAPYNPQNAQGVGFMASSFGQGVMGQIGGIPVIMSAALDSGEAFLMSTAALEIWEQRIGMLQVVEPSVLGVQVAYAGYFTTYTATAGAIVPLVEATV